MEEKEEKEVTAGFFIFHMGNFYEMCWGGHTKDYVEAMNWFKKGAAHGDGQSAYRLGLMYEKGMGVPVVDKEAIKWFQLAVDKPKFGNRAKAELKKTGRGTQLTRPQLKARNTLSHDRKY